MIWPALLRPVQGQFTGPDERFICPEDLRKALPVVEEVRVDKIELMEQVVFVAGSPAWPTTAQCTGRRRATADPVRHSGSRIAQVVGLIDDYHIDDRFAFCMVAEKPRQMRRRNPASIVVVPASWRPDAL